MIFHAVYGKELIVVLGTLGCKEPIDVWLRFGAKRPMPVVCTPDDMIVQLCVILIWRCMHLDLLCPFCITPIYRRISSSLPSFRLSRAFPTGSFMFPHTYANNMPDVITL